ncbi:glycoside hydrolase family 3 protein [Spirochaeta cellobiosiphila]|uniref:glycoside hydrolase family 3 protein n=1 Tax=Spirochaeta cellobiosiphila TaxID=504483 RepID=UPI00042A2C8C|nr:glycoside hydrolase family 3 protein [Spirochaeta cellobiosiphila]
MSKDFVILLTLMRLLFITYIFFTSIFLTFSQKVDFWTDLPTEDWLTNMVEEMTPEEKLGQILLLGYEGETPNRDIMNWISQKHLGGVKIFGWNADNLKTLTEAISTMQEASQSTRLKIPLFTATDQEGGWVRHIRGTTSITPGNMAIGATGIPDDALLTGYYIGRELRTLGINMNFAPTVDVYTNPEAHVIGPRAFSDNPYQVALLGLGFYYGLEKNRIIATAKHFPGHGHADKDSHGDLPLIDRTLEDLEAIDLVPFRFLIEENIPAIMSGHLAYPQITEKVEPASLSYELSQTLLREHMSYDNILITDDLYMGGAQTTGITFPDIGVEAINAGNDILLISQTPYLHNIVWRRLLEEYNKNDAFKVRVNESVKRILRIKRQYLYEDDRVPLNPSPQSIDSHIPDPDGSKFFKDLAQRAVTLIKGDKEKLVIKPDLIISQYSYALNYGTHLWPGARTLYYSYNPFYSYSQREFQQIKNNVRRAKSVLFVMATPGSYEILTQLEEYKDKITVLSLMTPIYFRFMPWIEKGIAVYGSGNESIKAGIDTLHGDLKPTGYIPIEVN